MAIFDPIRMGAAGAGGDYEIERSVRFNSGDSAHFSRTLSSDGDRRLWTWSGWLKLGKQPSGQRFIFSQRTSSSNQCNIQYSSEGKFRFESGGGKGNAFTQGKFRDPSAWYHLLVTLDSDNGTANDRIIIYVNGERQALDISPTISTGDHGINNNNAQVLGREADTNSLEWDGYMAEIHFIDGARKQPSDFAETDSVTGEYKPIEYTGTYGSQGWYYNFSDNSNNTASTLGKDYSGNGNNTTPGNISVSSGVGNDSVTDTPTNNWCVLNPVSRFQAQPPEDGNLRFFGQGGGDGSVVGTHVLKPGKKYYWEFEYTESGGGSQCPVGITDDLFQRQFIKGGSTTGMFAFDFRGGAGTPGAKDEGSVTNMGSRPSNGDICGIALDLSAGKMYAHKANSYYNSGNPDNGTGAVITGIPTDRDYLLHVSVDAGGGGNETFFRFNFGQQGFSHQPSTFTDLLNSQSIDDPTATPGTEYFNTVTYTANRSARSITGVGFQPDWVWIKSRDASQDHAVFDAIRGAGKSFRTNVNQNELNFNNTLTSFDSDGFSLGNDANVGDVNYAQVAHVAWNWFAGGSTVTNTDGNISSQVRASTTAGISIVGYSGNGSNGQTVGHGLGVAPDAIILKCRTANQNWRVWHKSLATNGSKRLILDQTNASEDAGFLNDTAPTSTVFTLGNADEAWNESGDTYIAYVFSGVEGFSKFGEYTGNANSDGVFVFTGFRPAWIMVKRSSDTENWAVWDSVRDGGSNPNGFLLRPDLTETEGGNVGAHQIDILSNGFKLRNSDSKGNGSGSEYVYFAFAELPFKFARAR